MNQLMTALRESIAKHEKKLEEMNKALLALENVCEHKYSFDSISETLKCIHCGKIKVQ